MCGMQIPSSPLKWAISCATVIGFEYPSKAFFNTATFASASLVSLASVSALQWNHFGTIFVLINVQVMLLFLRTANQINHLVGATQSQRFAENLDISLSIIACMTFQGCHCIL